MKIERDEWMDNMSTNEDEEMMENIFCSREFMESLHQLRQAIHIAATVKELIEKK